MPAHSSTASTVSPVPSFSTNVAEPAPETGRTWSIAILATAAFILVTTEFLIVGLLPMMAKDLSISISTAGLLVTLFAFTVMAFGPPLTALVAHLERKRLFIVILLIFAVSNALAAIAPNLWVLGLARFIPALALPVFWGTASETAGQIAGPARAGRAVSSVYLGISAAMLFGIPLGTLAANAIGWRGAFWLLAATSLLIALMLQFGMPTLRSPQRVRLKEQLTIFRDVQFVANVALSVVVFTAMFSAYTYLAETLENAAGIPKPQVGWWLMGFGAVGLLGNWLGGRLAETRPLAATGLFSAILAVGMALSMAVVGSHFWLCIVLAVWGVANTALYPICQIRVMKAASHAKALAGTLNVSAANAGIGLGAVVGGFAISQYGTTSVGYVAGAIAVIAVVAVPAIARLRPAAVPE